MSERIPLSSQPVSTMWFIWVHFFPSGVKLELVDTMFQSPLFFGLSSSALTILIRLIDRSGHGHNLQGNNIMGK